MCSKNYGLPRIRTKSNAMVLDVPEPELFVEEGDPIFPIAEAKRKALMGGGSEDDPLELKVYDLKEVPFPVGGDDPSTPSGPKSRSVYITVERILKFKDRAVGPPLHGRQLRWPTYGRWRC